MNAASGIATDSRAGMQRVIPPWEFRHLRRWASARVGGGIVLTACGVLTLTFGGNDAKTYWWAAVFLASAALSFAAGCWELSIARRAGPRS